MSERPEAQTSLQVNDWTPRGRLPGLATEPSCSCEPKPADRPNAQTQQTPQRACDPARSS
eukprot:15463952-Alexandrium_andersonii.AAC.1